LTDDTIVIDADDEPSIPAEDPVDTTEGPQTFAALFLSQYLPIVLGMASFTKDPRMGVQLRLKAADVALQLTYSIIQRSDRLASRGTTE
jgi:hypothetical protein